jgi:hypothetical protein
LLFLLYIENTRKMENNNVIQQLEENEQEAIEGIPVCGANFVSPVTHTTNFIEEIHYKIGTRLYIENAD